MERMSSEEIEGQSKNLELIESNRTELRKTGKKIVETDKWVTRSAARIIGKISSNMVLRSGTKLSKCDQYKVRNGLRKHASKEILRTNRNVGKENIPLVTKEREDKLNTTNSRNIDGEIKENKLRKLPIRPGTRVIITRAMARIITRRQARSKVSEIIGKRKVACKMKRKLGHRTKPARNTKKNIAIAEPTRNTKTNIVNDNATNLRTKRIVKPINLEDFVYTYTKANRDTRKHTPADPIRQITKRHDQSPRKFLKLKSSGKIVKKPEGNNRNYILFTGRKIFVDNINIIKRMNWNCRIVLKPIRFQATTNKHLNYRSEIIEQMYHDKFDQNRHENELYRANSFHTYAKKLVTVLSCMQPNESIFCQPENYESIERNLEVTPDIKQNEHDEKLAKENLDMVNNAESCSASTKHGAELGIITRSRLNLDKETESSTQYNIYRDNSSQFQVEQSGTTLERESIPTDTNLLITHKNQEYTT
ncbi:hypothetical protein M8J75_000250 [Diaphorina citri]|nr:hypothetical protein M8J75_000250 [Diaphorina citri]